MLHRLRSVLVRPGRDRLTGTVEVDETYFGGEEPGLRGGRQVGKKVLVGVAVERCGKGFGRCRCRSSLTPPSTRYAASSPRMSSQDPPLSPTPGRAARQPPRATICTSRSMRITAASPPMLCCRVCTAWLHSPSAGTWERTRGASMTLTCRAISTSLSSVSIADAREAAGFSSIGCSSSPSTTIRCATANSLQTPGRSPLRLSRRWSADTRPPSTAREPIDHGEQSDLGRCGQMNNPYPALAHAGFDRNSAPER